MRNQMKLYRGPSCTLSVDRHPRRIPAERSDILLDPFEGLYLVKKAHIKVSIGGVCEFRNSKEPEGRKAVVDGDDDNVGTLMDPMVEWKVSGVTVNVASAVDVNEYGYWRDVRVSSLRMLSRYLQLLP